MTPASGWRNLFDTLMVQSPMAMLPLGHSLAQQGDLAAVTEWMHAVGQAKWVGLMVSDPQHIGPLPVPLLDSAQAKPLDIKLNPAVVIAIALSADKERVRTDAAFSSEEAALVEAYLSAAKGHNLEKHLHTELLWGVCAHCDRGAAVKAALATGADPTLLGLNQTMANRGMYNLDTALSVSLKSNETSRPNAFLALCDHLGPRTFLDGNEYLGIDMGGLYGGIKGSSSYSPGPKIWQQLLSAADPAPGLAAMLEIEHRAPSEGNHDIASQLQHGRASLVANHIKYTASLGQPWNEALVGFLLGRDQMFTAANGRPIEQTVGICEAIRAPGPGFKNGGGQDVAFQIQIGLAGHCRPLLELYEKILSELKDSPDLLQRATTQLIAANARAQQVDRSPMPLSFVVNGLDKAQVQVASRLADVLDLLENKGLLDNERAPDRRNAMHHLAAGPSEKRAEWFFRLVELGIDPDGRDARGNKPASLIEDRDQRTEWNGYIRLLKARQAAHAAIEEVGMRP